MIQVYNSVPSIYYNESRDFQVLGRVFEILFNFNKTEIDLLKENLLSNNSDISLLPLVTKTLGFESKHDYNVDDLKALCNSFIHILNNKGSLYAIEESIHVLLNAQHINKQFDIVISDDDKYNLDIYLPAEVKDLILLEDVFNYILPTGFTYNFIYADFSEPLTTELNLTSEVKNYKFTQTQLGQVTKPKINDKRPNDDSNELGLTFTSVIVGGRDK